MTTPQVVTPDDVVAARETLRDVISSTPVLHSRVLSELIGGPVFLKAENLQRTRAFKIPGAYLRVAPMSQAPPAPRGVPPRPGNHPPGAPAPAAHPAPRPPPLLPPP